MIDISCTLYNVHCMLYSVHCIVYITHCAMYTSHCEVHSVYVTTYMHMECTLYIVHRSYIVQCMVYNTCIARRGTRYIHGTMGVDLDLLRGMS